MIEGWGGAEPIVKTARKNQTEAYLSVVEQTYSSFEPPEFGQLSHLDRKDRAEKQAKNQVQMRSPLTKLLHAVALPNASLLCRSHPLPHRIL